MIRQIVHLSHLLNSLGNLIRPEVIVSTMIIVTLFNNLFMKMLRPSKWM